MTLAVHTCSRSDTVKRPGEHFSRHSWPCLWPVILELNLRHLTAQQQANSPKASSSQGPCASGSGFARSGPPSPPPLPKFLCTYGVLRPPSCKFLRGKLLVGLICFSRLPGSPGRRSTPTNTTDPGTWGSQQVRWMPFSPAALFRSSLSNSSRRLSSALLLLTQPQCTAFASYGTSAAEHLQLSTYRTTADL